jgi:BirA family biotin operon repressor/biotin-[acetyl-CoA-carboxylase] ligase
VVAATGFRRALDSLHAGPPAVTVGGVPPEVVPRWIEDARATVQGGRFALVEWVAETGSTNSDLVAGFDRMAPTDVVLVADHQTAGRGRLDRHWVAPPGQNLLLSVRTTPRCPIERWALATAAMALAVVDVADALGVEDAGIRWPNDVIAGGRAPGKLAGILAELVVDAGAPSAVVIGVGLNTGWPESPDARAELSATSLAACIDRRPDRGAVLGHLLMQFAETLQLLEHDPGGLRDRHLARSITVGRAVRIARADGSHVEGHAVDIDASGRIVVRIDGIDEAFSAGDVTHLR